MDSLPVGALWVIAFAVWFIPGLALWLADPIGRFLRRQAEAAGGSSVEK
jgi:hypothetical protein